MKRYINFFEKNKKRFDHICHPLINFFREESFECFKQTGFSSFFSEEYCKTDIAGLLGKNLTLEMFDVFQKPVDPYKIFHYNILYKMNYLQYFIINGRYFESGGMGKKLSHEIFSGSLNMFALQYPDLFLKYYNRQVRSVKNGLADFNTMFVQDGYVLYIPKNIILNDPIQLTNILCGKKDLIINRRILIFLGANTQAKILMYDYTVNKQSTFAFTQITETYLDKNAVLDFYEIEENTKKTIRLTHHFVYQEAFSKLTLHPITLKNGITYNKYNINLDGEQSKIYLFGLVIADEKQKIDNITNICHSAQKCQSNELFKYLLDEKSIGIFIGKIIVKKKAIQTEAYQNNQNVLIGNRCRMYSTPQLEINTNDVKCSHGMSMGQLNKSALFYMQSRGISKKKAQYLLKLAFAIDMLKEIHLKKLKKCLQSIIENRF